MKTVVNGPAFEVRVESGLFALDLDHDAESNESEQVNSVERTRRW